MSADDIKRRFSLDEVAAFLDGSGTLDGISFGEPHPTERGMYWWRKHLRAAILADRASRAPSPQGDAEAWTAEPPTEQGWYWHWSGEPDTAPLPTSVLWSGFMGCCFVSAGQLGIQGAIPVKDHGGFWMRMSTPATEKGE